MTVLQERRYATSSNRNVDNFLRNNGTKAHGNGRLPLQYGNYAGMELDDLKHHVGVRKKDTNHDLTLGAWLGPVKDHAKKAGIAAKSYKKAAVKTELGNEIPEIVAVELAGTPEVKPTAKVVYYADDKTTHYEAASEKKVNPKKAQRQAALEASGTVPKKVNADMARAEKMAGMAKRQPRIMTKQ